MFKGMSTSGPVLEKPGDLAAILTNLQARDVLFIDEVHRMSPVIEEILYPALEDFELGFASRHRGDQIAKRVARERPRQVGGSKRAFAFDAVVRGPAGCWRR